jgi:hypothetical protein
MEKIRDATISGFNEYKSQLQSQPGEVSLQLVQFNHDYELVFDKPLTQVPDLTRDTYVPSGNTALYDAQGRTIHNIGHTLNQTPEAQRPGRVVIVTISDGEENWSRLYDHDQIAAMIRHQQGTYNWEFLFLGANQDAIAVAQHLNIPTRSAMKYAATPQGIRNTFAAAAGYTNSVRGQSLGGNVNYRGFFSDDDRVAAMADEQEPSGGQWAGKDKTTQRETVNR